MQLLVAGLLVVFPSACGSDGSAGGESVISAGDNAADSTRDFTSTTSEITSLSGLRCPDDLFEIGNIDYASGTLGAGTPIGAAATYLGLEPDDPALDSKPKKSGRVLVLYTPTSGTPAAITVADYGSGWLVEATETCAGSKYSRPSPS